MEMAPEKFQMKKILFVFLFFSILFQLSSQSTLASSSYVLPYPSTMPGSKLYKIHVLWEYMQKYWYFGDFGQFTYNLKESDEFLVQAKTLFEYNQFLLGYEALQKSNQYFVKIYPNLMNATRHKKNISDYTILLQEASKKHIEVLEKMKQETPATFVWNPEKSTPTTLLIHALIDNTIAMRKTTL